MSNAAFAHAPVCGMFWAELHKAANRRRGAGTHYVDGMMLLVKAAEVDGVIDKIQCIGPEKKVAI